MRIQHNIAAMNSYRNYNVNAGALNKNLEKLSSGYKINRAGDDAAGLAISEKMRAQITGLETASKNVKDGISLVKTAEGALQEVHDMLNRMEELATQSANGTYDNEVDRANLQKEVDALKSEINRIADSSNFNGIKLLDGSLAKGNVTEVTTTTTDAAATTDVQTMMIDGMKASVTNIAAKGNQFSTTIATKNSAAGTLKLNWTNEDGTKGEAIMDMAVPADVTAGAKAIATYINQHNELSELFEAKATTGGKLTITTKEVGSGVLTKFDSIKIDSGATGFNLGTVTKNTGFDRGVLLDKWDNGSGTMTTMTNSSTLIKEGDTITIGSKTYEFVKSSDSKVKTEGGVAVVMGTNDVASLTKLQEALENNGIKSAATVKNTTGKYLGYVTTTSAASVKGLFIEANEIKVNQNTPYGATSESDGFVIKNEIAEAGAYMFKAEAASKSNVDNALTISYLDENGQAQSRTVNYKAVTTSKTDAAIGMKNAILNDEVLKELFDVSIDTTNKDQITLTAKTAGTKGAVLTGVSSSDDASGVGVADTIEKKVEAKDATISVELDLDNITSGDMIEIGGQKFQLVNDPSQATTDNAIVYSATATGATAAEKKSASEQLVASLKANGIEAKYDATTNKVMLTAPKEDIVKQESTTTENNGGLVLQIGDTSDNFNKLEVNVGDMHVKGMIHEVKDEKTGEVVETKTLADVNISTQDGAAAAIDVIKSAINYVSSVRGDLGAVQNRLEHTQNNLSVMTENIQDAESSIRDTDVAAEMMQYTKNNILLQSAQAMLAQANQLPQGVLQLLG